MGSPLPRFLLFLRWDRRHGIEDCVPSKSLPHPKLLVGESVLRGNRQTDNILRRMHISRCPHSTLSLPVSPSSRHLQDKGHLLHTAFPLMIARSSQVLASTPVSSTQSLQGGYFFCCSCRFFFNCSRVMGWLHSIVRMPQTIPAPFYRRRSQPLPLERNIPTTLVDYPARRRLSKFHVPCSTTRP